MSAEGMGVGEPQEASLSLVKGKAHVSRAFDTLDMGSWKVVIMKGPTLSCKLLELHGSEPRQTLLQQSAPLVRSKTSGF